MKARFGILIGVLVFLILAVLGLWLWQQQRPEVRLLRITPSPQTEVLGPGTIFPTLDLVTPEGSCAPPADNLTFFGSCCSDQACSGQCVRDPSGSVGCACYDVQGGCQEGTVCCKLRRGCVRPEECETP